MAEAQPFYKSLAEAFPARRSPQGCKTPHIPMSMDNWAHPWQCPSSPAPGTWAGKRWDEGNSLFSAVPCWSPNIKRFSIDCWAIMVIILNPFSLIFWEFTNNGVNNSTHPWNWLVWERAGIEFWGRKFSFFHGKLLGQFRETNWNHTQRTLPSW